MFVAPVARRNARHLAAPAVAAARGWRRASRCPVLACALAPARGRERRADPDHVQFTLEGCRLPAGATLPNSSGQFVCADADYTPGNLGKNWHELDLVPHRLTAQAGPAQTYTVAIAADNRDGSRPGYDVISVPVVNALLSTGTCAVSAGPQSLLTPGQGGVDVTIYRDLTITQSAGSHCVFDYFERLALGSHLFPGSSLHSNLLNQAHTTAGVGAREVPIPVNQILAQGMSKTMTATTGNSSVWNVTKDSLPTDVNFDTCAGGAMAQARQVTITIRWTKTATSNGSVTIISNITLSNPAGRDVSATVQDKIYAGATQTTQVGTTYNSGPTVVPARGTKTLTNVQTIPTSAATSYNDVATATYNEVVPGLPPIPGTVTATASASLVSISTPNNSATVTDREQISGAGLSFSIDQVTSSDPGGTFDVPYTVGSGRTDHRADHVDERRHELRLGGAPQDDLRRRAAQHDRHAVGYRARRRQPRGDARRRRERGDHDQRARLPAGPEVRRLRRRRHPRPR